MFFDSYYGMGGIAMLQLLLDMRRTAERHAVPVPVPVEVHRLIWLRQR